MRERQFCAIIDSSQSNLDPRLSGILYAAHPAPSHDDVSRWLNFEKLTTGLVLCAIEHAEAQAIAPTDARIAFRQKNGACVRAPPMRDAFGRRDGVEDDCRRRFDTTHKSKTGHYFLLRASASLRSA